MCFILETTPPEGIALHGKGSFRAHVVCSEELFRSLPKAASFNYVRPSACSQRETSEIISVNEAAKCISDDWVGRLPTRCAEAVLCVRSSLVGDVWLTNRKSGVGVKVRTPKK